MFKGRHIQVCHLKINNSWPNRHTMKVVRVKIKTTEATFQCCTAHSHTLVCSMLVVVVIPTKVRNSGIAAVS